MSTATAPRTSLSAAAFLLDLSDSRGLKAIEIAASAAAWTQGRLKDGTKFYAIPGSAGHVYWTNLARCTCPDFERRLQPCKHVQAVKLHCARVRAHQPRQARTRRASARPAAAPLARVQVAKPAKALPALAPETLALAARYDALYAEDAA